MIDRIEPAMRRLRRAVDRSHLTARLLHLPASEGNPSRAGLLVVQIDGLSRERLLRAIDDGRLPFVRHLVVDEGHRVTPYYCGLPSTTPVVQAELFYGVRGAVPGFSFLDRASGRTFRMYERHAVSTVEARLTPERSLLAGGASYCNIYTGGAHDARFCMASLGPGDLFRSAHRAALPVLGVLYAPDVVRAAGLVAWEALVAPGGLLEGLRRGHHPRSELKFVQTRVVISVLLREMIATAARMDLARGLPVVWVNLVGYDESGHRRGPDSALAAHSLGSIDSVVARLTRAARRSPLRSYDVWVLADHGQEATVPYVEEHGRSVAEAVAEVFARHGMVAEPSTEPPEGIQGQRARLLGERLIGIVVPGLDVTTQLRRPGRALTTAQGSVGHVYGPRPLTSDERAAVARDLVAVAGIPLTLVADGPGTARAWTPEGEVALPAEAARLLGADHPYLAALAADLVALAHHPDAGDVVISGWRPGPRSVSFPHENGAHSGPGPRETDAFVLAPGDLVFEPADGETVRPADLRRTALDLLDGRRRRAASGASDERLRVVTYNVHSCVGLDGKLSPERVARVLARLDPDIVALQELDVGRSRTGGVDQAAVLAHELEMLLEFHPTIAFEEEQFGDAVLSRHPMRLVRAGSLPRLPGHPELEPRGVLWVEIDGPGGPWHVLNTHLSIHPRERALQTDALLGPAWLAHRELHRPVLCGDFNAAPWFPTCRRLSRRLRDAQRALADHRPRRTWGGRLPTWRIDHVFVDPSIDVVAVDVPTTSLTRVASDHLPLVVDLRPEARPGARRPAPDRDLQSRQ